MISRINSSHFFNTLSNILDYKFWIPWSVSKISIYDLLSRVCLIFMFCQLCLGIYVFLDKKLKAQSESQRMAISQNSRSEEDGFDDNGYWVTMNHLDPKFLEDNPEGFYDNLKETLAFGRNAYVLFMEYSQAFTDVENQVYLSKSDLQHLSDSGPFFYDIRSANKAAVEYYSHFIKPRYSRNRDHWLAYDAWIEAMDEELENSTICGKQLEIGCFVGDKAIQMSWLKAQYTATGIMVVRLCKVPEVIEKQELQSAT